MFRLRSTRVTVVIGELLTSRDRSEVPNVVEELRAQLSNELSASPPCSTPIFAGRQNTWSSSICSMVRALAAFWLRTASQQGSNTYLIDPEGPLRRSLSVERNSPSGDAIEGCVAGQGAELATPLAVEP